MAKITFLTGTLAFIGLLFVLAIGNSPVIPQAEANQAEELERITVVAPRFTREREREPGGRMFEVTTVERSANVDFSDLDLSRTVDMYELEDRVKQAATRVCEELAEQYPDGEPATSVCIERAIADTMAQARLIASGM